MHPYFSKFLTLKISVYKELFEKLPLLLVWSYSDQDHIRSSVPWIIFINFLCFSFRKRGENGEKRCCTRWTTKECHHYNIPIVLKSGFRTQIECLFCHRGHLKPCVPAKLTSLCSRLPNLTISDLHGHIAQHRVEIRTSLYRQNDN